MSWSAAGLLSLAVLCGGACSNRGDTGGKSRAPTIDAAAPQSDLGAQALDFDVRWPLVDPADQKPPTTKVLLTGRLSVEPCKLDTPEARIRIRLTLTRPHDEAHREFWNESLMYREFGWMRYVRVWDEDEKWLYPNLAFLFTLHGVDREERYGGWDPGKHVDNDFGAVLIRKYDAAGEKEQADTATGPLVSADWHTVGANGAVKRTIAHLAESDVFTVHLAEAEPPYEGRIKVWFVYGDFLGHRVPQSWPKEPEFNGGSIAMFHVDWQYQPGTSFQPVLTQHTPPEHTGFDWREWIGRTEPSEKPMGEARLVDR